MQSVIDNIAEPTIIDTIDHYLSQYPDTNTLAYCIVTPLQASNNSHTSAEYNNQA